MDFHTVMQWPQSMIRKSHFSKKLELNHMVIIHIAKRLTKRLTKNIDLIVNKILILKKG